MKHEEINSRFFCFVFFINARPLMQSRDRVGEFHLSTEEES